MLMSFRSLAMIAAALAVAVVALVWQNLGLREQLGHARTGSQAGACPAIAPAPALCPAPGAPAQQAGQPAVASTLVASQPKAPQASSLEDALKARLAEQQSPGMQLSPFGAASAPTGAGR
jgi:hypothetical protein